jgi:hypothetical protein
MARKLMAQNNGLDKSTICCCDRAGTQPAASDAGRKAR